MMTVPMDNSSALSGKELAQLLFSKNVELENGLRIAAKAKVPSDPNVWLQMRDNYEAIIIEDHDFSEKYEIEYALWQLHYRRIEEFRAHISASGSVAPSQSGGKGNIGRTERAKKIRSFFKSFLSEATGFYHDLILKIRAKYGLPLCYFSENPEHQMISEKDLKKPVDVKIGLLSCHRCLIYLGDLARYKELYGEASDSVARDYAAASSYYIQAASLWPSSGNPHHQLAILASYSGDEVLAIYRYFRSLAVDSPFSTARDNLIIAFEKNRQCYSQLPGEAKALVKAPARSSGRGRGRGEARLKENKTEACFVKEQLSGGTSTFKTFCTRFIRLNGILFTRTSLETFEDVSSVVISELCDLLSSGSEEHLNFGSNVAENSLFIVRLVAILIFTVHNVNKESDGQSYMEILQRSVLLQNAFTATFEVVGHIFKRCSELQDSISSYLLPAVLVFIEWLACRPDVAAGSDVDEKQLNVRSFFWTHCIDLLNKIVSSGYASIEGDEDELCFVDIGKYDDGEPTNRLALWEDFELRGFLPLHAAHLILDFSGKHSFGNGSSSKEKGARVERVLAAGRSLMNVIQINQHSVYYDKKFKKFCVGEPPEPETGLFGPLSNGLSRYAQSVAEVRTSAIPHLPEGKPFSEEGEDEDEVIVFRPSLSDRLTDARTSSLMASVSSDWPGYGTVATAPPPGNISRAQVVDALSTGVKPSLSVTTAGSTFPYTSNLTLLERLKDQVLVDEVKSLSIVGNGSAVEEGQLQEASVSLTGSNQLPATVNFSASFSVSAVDAKPSVSDSAVLSGAFMDPSGEAPRPSISASSRRSPIGRPVSRHYGPPPGFNPVPPKISNESSTSLPLKSGQELSLDDDYRWLDGYQYPQKEKKEPHVVSNHNAAVGGNNGCLRADMMNFLFPGAQGPPQWLVERKKIWQDTDPKCLKYLKGQQLQEGSSPPGGTLHNHSLWSDGFFV